MDEQAEYQAALARINQAWEWMFGMAALSATGVGIELGLFEVLQADGPAKPVDLARRLGLQQRPVETWARVLIQNELLEPDDDGRVGLAPGVAAMVCPPRTLLSLAPSIEFHARFLARDFLDLPAFFRDGLTHPPGRHGRALTWNIAEQTAAMHAVFVAGALPDLADITIKLQAGAAVLDVGCGTGNLGVALCSAFPRVSYTGIDTNHDVITQGHSAIVPAGLEGRMRLDAGEVERLVAPGAFDLGLLFLAYHEIEPAARAETLQAIRRALREDAVLVVVDETYPAQPVDARAREAKMGIHFDYTEMLWGSLVPTREELDAALTEAGFVPERRTVMDGSMEVVLAWAK